MREYTGIRNILPVAVLLVVFVWLLGLGTGICFLNATSFASLMCSVFLNRISIVGLLSSLVIPILFSYILTRCCNLYFILPIVFLKAFTFMCCFGSVIFAFNNAGWLITGMLLFSDFFLVISLLFVWVRFALGKRYPPVGLIVLHIAILLTIGCFDYFAVSPFAMTLLN